MPDPKAVGMQHGGILVPYVTLLSRLSILTLELVVAIGIHHLS